MEIMGDRTMQLFGSISNLANSEPPSVPGSTYPSNPVYFDMIGRVYKVGVRFDF
jgi:outer membrane receptor protein involved in Fe transport